MLTFETKRAVVEYLDDLVDKGLLAKAGDGGYYQAGRYVCSRGEIHSPDYYPTSFEDGWGITMVSHYLPGTRNAPPPCVRVVDLWSEDDGDMGSVLLCGY